MLHVVARRRLAVHVPSDADGTLLLEGSWPDGDAADLPTRVALDDFLDGDDAWIDRAASDVAEQLGARDRAPGDANFYFDNALRLRYAVVKWLRVLAWRRANSGSFRSTTTLHVSTAADDDEYVALWNVVAAADAFRLRVVRHDEAAAASPPARVRNAWWRRSLARLAGPKAPLGGVTSRRILLCGNPTILSPVCEELLRQGAEVAWLFDRFAVRTWLRWRRRGVDMFTCDDDADSSADERRTVREPAGSVVFDDVDLGDVAETWRNRLQPTVAAAQARQRRRVRRALDAFRPTHVVVDEDATHLPRLLVDIAKEFGTASAVVQHGACGVRFGFAPLVADQIFAIDDAARVQLLEWGIARDRIVVTGSPGREKFIAAVHAAVAARDRGASQATRRRQILLLSTTPPRDARPDAISYRLTTRTYAGMLDAAFQAAAELGDCELLFRPHPRTAADPIFDAVRRRFPNTALRVTARRESLADLVADADCILSCASSAGIDAAAAGRCVIQLVPQGSVGVLPAARHGMFGEARTAAELLPLLRRVDEFKTEVESDSDTPHEPTPGAAQRIVQALWSMPFTGPHRTAQRPPRREGVHA